jgi:hypothetical protein
MASFFPIGGAPIAGQLRYNKNPSNKLVLIAALAAAWSIVPDNGFIGGRAPYEPRRLPPSILDVRVDRPVPHYSPAHLPVIASWPRDADHLPQYTRKLPQGVFAPSVDNPIPRYAPANWPVIASWPREPDPLPQTTRKLTPPRSVDNPPRGRPVDRILKQAGNWGYEPIPPAQRKLTLARADFVSVIQQRSWFNAVWDSWKPQEQALLRRTFTPVIVAPPPFTRGWLATVQVSWDVTEARAQRAPYLVIPPFVPPVVVTDCGHLYPSNYKYADLTEAFYTSGMLTEAISAPGSQRNAISKAGSSRSTASKAGSMKSEIPC